MNFTKQSQEAVISAFLKSGFVVDAQTINAFPYQSDFLIQMECTLTTPNQMSNRVVNLIVAQSLTGIRTVMEDIVHEGVLKGTRDMSKVSISTPKVTYIFIINSKQLERLLKDVKDVKDVN